MRYILRPAFNTFALKHIMYLAHMGKVVIGSRVPHPRHIPIKYRNMTAAFKGDFSLREVERLRFHFKGGS
jgi:hypothetical protein